MDGLPIGISILKSLFLLLLPLWRHYFFFCGRSFPPPSDRGDVVRGTPEIFFRRLKSWKGEDFPPVFVRSFFSIATQIIPPIFLNLPL